MHPIYLAVPTDILHVDPDDGAWMANAKAMAICKRNAPVHYIFDTVSPAINPRTHLRHCTYEKRHGRWRRPEETTRPRWPVASAGLEDGLFEGIICVVYIPLRFWRARSHVLHVLHATSTLRGRSSTYFQFQPQVFSQKFSVRSLSASTCPRPVSFVFNLF